jgi:hypothetical protein
MQGNEIRDLERPLDGGLIPIEALIEVVKSDSPNEWARYCDLAHQLAQEDGPTEISQEDAGRRNLAANSKRLHQKDKSHLVRLFNRGLAGGPAMPLTKFEIMAAETQNFEGQFRDRLLLALKTGRYSLIAFDRLKEVTVPPALIKPEHFRFESKEMELGDGIKLSGVRIVPRQTVSADPPGRKPGRMSAKALACRAALAILDDASRRPPPGHGRKAALARMVCNELRNYGPSYQEDTVQKMIRGTVKEWEAANPDK